MKTEFVITVRLLLFLLILTLSIYSTAVGPAMSVDKNQSTIYDSILTNTTIPLVDYGYINGSYIGLQINPINIAQSVIREYQALDHGANQSNQTIKKIILQSDWLQANAWDNGKYALLPYTFKFDPYDMSPPWFSAMAQGQGVQALGYAYNLTKDGKYLATADKLLNALYVEVKDGGVTYKSPQDGWWYEEYASTRSTKEPRVLNGMMFTLIGLNEFFEITKNEKAKNLFDLGIISLKKNLHNYDSDKFSMYDALGRQGLFYHKVHLEQLQDLYSITGDQFFKDYFNLWNARLD